MLGHPRLVSVAAALVSVAGLSCRHGRHVQGKRTAEAEKKKTVRSSISRRGSCGIFSGLMSSAMSFGLQGVGIQNSR